MRVRKVSADSRGHVKTAVFLTVDRGIANLRAMKILACVFSLTFACCAFGAPAAAREARSAAIHAALTRFHDEDRFNGVALVARDGKVIHEAAYGARSATHPAPLQVDDRFNIGSIAKEFSAVAVMRLHERGRLDLDVPVARILDDLPAWSQKVTTHQLLDYTSGLPDLRWREIRNDRDVYADLQKVTELEFEPGTKYGYRYQNVMLRQFVVEKVAAVPFNVYVERRIFKPCRMKHAALNLPANAPRLAASFNRERKADDTFMPITGVVFATAGDLWRWSECLHGARVLTPASIALLGHGFNPENGALGRMVWNRDRLVEHAHLGQSRNFEALMYSNLSRRITVVLLSNSRRDNLEQILKAVEPMATATD